jgi:hypothetical protein
MITFGPLEAGQIALITTLPRLRSVVDLSPAPVTPSSQNLDLFQTILKDLIDFATRATCRRCCRSSRTSSASGRRRVCSTRYLTGRFNNPIPAKVEGAQPVASKIAVSITGGNSASKIISSVTPFRRMSVR